MEASRTVSQSYVAFASAVRRLLLPTTSRAPKTRLGHDRLAQDRAFSSTVEAAASAVGSASSPRPLPVYATYGLQSLIAQRMSWDHWPAGPPQALGVDELELPMPFTTPPPPRSLSVEHEEEPVEPQESSSPPTLHRPTTHLHSGPRAARLMLSKGKLGQGMLHFQEALRKTSIPHTLLPPLSPGERSPIRQEDLIREGDFEAILLELRLIFSGRRQLDRAAAWERKAWRPDGLPLDRNIGDVPQSILAAFAMGSTFDSCIAMGYRPSSRMVAILISCLSHLLPTEAFTEAVELAMSSRGGENMGRDILAAIVVGYGRAGQPEKGEAYLARYTDLHRDVSASATKLSASNVDSDGWSHDVGIWNALVRSHAIAGQHGKAMAWLRRYSAFCQRPDVPKELKPQGSPSIYLTLLTSIAERKFTRGSSEGISDNVTREVMAVVSLMMQHGVKAHTAMLNFLADFERRRGEHVSAKKLLSQVASINAQADGLGQFENAVLPDGHDVDRTSQHILEERNNWDSHTYRQAFELVTQNSLAGAKKAADPASVLPSPRSLLSSLLNAHHQKARGRPRVTSSALHSITLLTAIKSCLTYRDYPAAVVALQTFTVCALPLPVAEVFKIISHGVKKHSFLAPAQMYSRLNDGVGSIPKIGPLQGMLEAAILHELQEGKESDCSDSPGWVRAALGASGASGASWDALPDTDKLHTVMRDVRKEVLPTRRSDKPVLTPEQLKAARKQAEMRAHRRSQQLGTVEVD
ncbi:hypothetical protein BCV69DRAFT_311238 [Microstroma glucosiphilum]|uniref:Uncharacterized protein n=1 Tax=Pseudomicrostroma glucosiphilum TaxID=1684307 RepID=A0A316UC43_9BASI|nr:hypothetical protein BCV69DRAFT_311238 [Pseudomicrostroma glucosiphilum]PWN22434.1 hypothetical protein BCV69DRAFT_311238 [Pseudomicrostroma glucosiphilum]